MEDQPHRQVGGRVAGARLPLQDGVFRGVEIKWAFTEVVPFSKDFCLGVCDVLTAVP